MKATGIVRRIDDLGRVVIPKEIRRTLRIREGDPLEIFTEKDGEVIFKKYSPVGELQDFAAQICETLNKTSGHVTVITDRDCIITVSGAPKRELLEKRISAELEQIMEERGIYQYKSGDRPLPPSDDVAAYSIGIAAPIIASGDILGSVVFLMTDNTPMGEVENKLAQTVARFLGRQMEA